MIYINNNTDNVLITESWLNYKPTEFLVYLDDIEIGTFPNKSVTNTYITLEIPKESLVGIQNKEYTLKLYKDFSILKTELCVVMKPGLNTIKSISNTQKN